MAMVNGASSRATAPMERFPCVLVLLPVLLLAALRPAQAQLVVGGVIPSDPAAEDPKEVEEVYDAYLRYAHRHEVKLR